MDTGNRYKKTLLQESKGRSIPLYCNYRDTSIHCNCRANEEKMSVDAERDGFV